MDDAPLDLTAHLEPIVRLVDGVTVGHELLLRPRAGGDLLAEAESAGMSLASVTAAALAAARRTLEAVAGPLHVNITPADLCDPGFAQQVLGVVGDRLPSLVLEVTEQSRLAGGPAVTANLAALRRHGARFAIDDLGDGWSDLRSLAIVRPELTKIRLERLLVPDRRITAWLRAQDAESRAWTIVEQIETAGDLALVRSFGFELAQGWYWCPGATEASPPAASELDSSSLHP